MREADMQMRTGRKTPIYGSGAKPEGEDNDANAISALEKPVSSKEGNTELERCDIEGFNTWTRADINMRVVRSRERKTKKDEIITSDWFWVTTIEKMQAPTELICKFGRRRWDIENQGFN